MVSHARRRWVVALTILNGPAIARGDGWSCWGIPLIPRLLLLLLHLGSITLSPIAAPLLLLLLLLALALAFALPFTITPLPIALALHLTVALRARVTTRWWGHVGAHRVVVLLPAHVDAGGRRHMETLLVVRARVPAQVVTRLRRGWRRWCQGCLLWGRRVGWHGHVSVVDRPRVD